MSVGGASITNGIGTVSGGMIDNADGHRYIVSLTGVADAQYITVTLNNVSDVAGDSPITISLQMGVLVGDINGDGVVNVGDTILVRQAAGVTLNGSNFRNDVTADGLVNIGDSVVVRSKSGDFLPAPPQATKPTGYLPVLVRPTVAH